MTHTLIIWYRPTHGRTKASSPYLRFFRVRPALMQRYLTLEVLSCHDPERQGLPKKTGPLQRVRTVARATPNVTNRASGLQPRVALAIAFFHKEKKLVRR